MFRHVRTYRRSGGIDFCRFCSVRMYAAFERETLLNRNSSLSVAGIGCCFYVHGILQKLRGQVTKDEVFVASRGRSSDRIPLRRSPRRAHGTLQPVWMKVL